MAVGSYVALAIATLVFYILVAPFAIYNAIRHGVKRSGPWYFMCILILARIIGEPMIIATNGVLDINNGVSIGGYVLSNVGLSPLLLMAGTVLLQVNSALGESNSAIDGRVARVMGLVPLVALILYAVGYSETGDSGHSLRVAAAALYLVYWAMLVLSSFMLWRVLHLHDRRARIFFFAVLISLPFLLVRTIDTALSTFGSTESQTSISYNIWIRAFMGTLMEFIVVLVIMVAGLVAPKETKPTVGQYRGQTGEVAGSQEMDKYEGQDNGTSRV